MAGRTPNLDRLAAEGMRFTDYYAEASCTAGRANFITGELPIRTGLTTVGQAGAPIGMPDEAPTIATALKSMGYATGQFGKNHLGDLNQFLPTRARLRRILRLPLSPRRDGGPLPSRTTRRRSRTRSVRATWCTAARPPWTTRPCSRAGARSASREIEDAGELCPKRMETVDDEILERDASSSSTRPSSDNKPFFVWLNPTRMHVVTHLSEKYEKMRNSENGWTIEEAGMAQLDDIVGVGDAEAEGPRHRQRHHHRLHHRQRRRRISPGPTAGRPRSPAARAPCSKAASACRCIAALAGQGAGRQGREPDRVRSRLVPDAGVGWPATRTSSRNSRRANRSAIAPTRSISTATTRPTCSPARASRSEARSSTSRKRRSARCASTTSSTASSISRRAGSAAPSRSTGRSSSICVSIPSSAPASADRSTIYNWFAYEFWRFVFVKQEVAKLRPDLHRLSADAEGRELQSRSPEAGAREENAGSQRHSRRHLLTTPRRRSPRANGAALRGCSG